MLKLLNIKIKGFSLWTKILLVKTISIILLEGLKVEKINEKDSGEFLAYFDSQKTIMWDV